MITSVAVDNFKRFRRAEVETRSMTVLTGLNGGGKSTLLQSLLLARYATEFPDQPVAPLNGPFGLALGEANEVLHLDAETQEIGITLRAGAQEYPYRFGVPDDARSLNLPVRGRPSVVPGVFSEHGRRFVYLSAERLGPRDQLQITAEDSTWLGVGDQGQYTAQVLATEQSTVVREALRHPKTKSHGVTTLRTQLEDWVAEILRPVRVEAQWPAGLSATIIRFSEPGWRGEPIRPANMGFGFSYALPIIVAGLLMPVGGLFIVENPEAHLHPAGQSRLGRFLARVAGSGVQVMIETHSDHVVNGVRLGIAVDRALPHGDTLMQFFGETAGAAHPVAVEVNPRGELTSWPTGFFDQLETDLGGLARTSQASSRGYGSRVDVVFHPSLNFGRFDGPYRDVLQAVVTAFGALNDHFARVMAEQAGIPHQVAAALGQYGLDLSPESPKTRASKKRMSERTVSFHGNIYQCEWHAKLTRGGNRIHFSLPQPDLGGRILIGIFVDHLET